MPGGPCVGDPSTPPCTPLPLPMQNDYCELWCLLNFIAPGCLRDKASFNASIAMPIKLGNKASATVFELNKART